MAGRGPGSTCWVTLAARVSPRPDPRAPASAGSSGAGMTAAPPARAAAVARRRGEEEEKEEEEGSRRSSRERRDPGGRAGKLRAEDTVRRPGQALSEWSLPFAARSGGGPVGDLGDLLGLVNPPTSGTHPRRVGEEGGACVRSEVAPPAEGLGVRPGPRLSRCPLPAAVGSPAPANYCPAPGWGRRGGGGGCLAERDACLGGLSEGRVGWRAEGGGCWSELRSGVLALPVAEMKCPAGRKAGGQTVSLPPSTPTSVPDLRCPSPPRASGAVACPQPRERECVHPLDGGLACTWS